MTRPLRVLRSLVQVCVVGAALVTGYRYAAGHSRVSVETYCPFGGLESALSLFTHHRFTCATGERNLASFVGLLVLAVLARRAFCGWVCPVGALSEWLVRLKAHFRGERASFAPPVPPRLDRRLRWLRLAVLAAILGLTYRAGELIFRGFDPYYVLFSFHGHDVKPWSYAVIGALIAGMGAIPMLWCRYLCPLGVALLPCATVGWLRIRRDRSTCTACGVCDRACPHTITVSTVHHVRSPECTLCLECTQACPTHALELRAEVGP